MNELATIAIFRTKLYTLYEIRHNISIKFVSSQSHNNAILFKYYIYKIYIYMLNK